MKWSEKGNLKSQIDNDIWSSAKKYKDFLYTYTNNQRSLDSLESKFDSIFSKNEIEICELGCGMGWLSAYLKSKYNSKIKNIDLIDYDPKFAELSKDMFNLYKTSYNNVQFINKSFENISELNSKYDLIIMSSSIHHFYDIYDFFNELQLKLKSHGYLILINENPINKLKFTFQLLKNY